MKTVFDNKQLAHVWAQQTQENGRSNSMSFYKQTIYSYATPIARIYPKPIGQRTMASHNYVVLITSEQFSMTTSSKHMPAVHSAVRHLVSFRVPYVLTNTPDGYNGSQDSMGKGNGVGTHADNLAWMLANYDDIKPRLIRARDITYLTDRDGFTASYQKLCLYASLFGLEEPKRDPNADWHDVLAQRAAKEARNNTPAKIAAREKAKARKAEKERIRAEEIAKLGGDMVAEWKAGYRDQLGYMFSRSPMHGAYLRVKGDEIETSLGAKVPVDHAKKAIKYIRLWVANGMTESDAKGYHMRVGHFTIDRIADNGNINAGCHFIEFSEIDRVGQQLGV